MIHRLSAMAPILFLIILAAASVWLERAVQSAFPEEKKLRHDPDFWAENLIVKKYGPEGTLKNTLTVSKMVHYPDDDTTILTKPSMRYHRTPSVTVSATTGLMSTDGKEIVLVDKALVTRESIETKPATQVATRILTLFTDDERAVSREPVTITQGLTVINGSGLDANNGTGITVVSGRVNGIIYRKQ